MNETYKVPMVFDKKNSFWVIDLCFHIPKKKKKKKGNLQWRKARGWKNIFFSLVSYKLSMGFEPTKSPFTLLLQGRWGVLELKLIGRTRK